MVFGSRPLWEVFWGNHILSLQVYVLIRNFVMLSSNIGTGVLRVDETHKPQLFQMNSVHCQ